ncbi:GSCOCG00004475001-RA-CDS, partial [Cotesia congregata]
MNQKISFDGNVYEFHDDDLPYEEEILRNQHSVRHWLRYLDHLKSTKSTNLSIVYERSLKELPGSYKLWYGYLSHRVSQLKNRRLDDPLYEDVNNAFERALIFMHKMPRIWIDYCTLMTEQCFVTRTRHIFDRALRALPITQHHRIWPLYLDFVKSHDIPETGIRVFRRYLKLAPEDTEDYIEYLISIGRLDEAAIKLAHIVNQDDFISKHGKSNHQLWNELCDLISKNPDKIKSLKVDPIIRGGLRRDFTQVFDAYSQFEEISTKKRMEEVSKNPNRTEDDEVELDLRLERFEYLMERRPLLLNSVLLRQNPHNVPEWHKRVKLYEGQPHEIINTFTEAVQTVKPQLAVGKFRTLWVVFTKFYEENGQLSDARVVFEQATHVPYTKVDDLASVWCEWAEMELRH